MMNSTTTSNKPSAEPTLAKPTPASRVLLALIHTYQHLSAGRQSPCRFYPSCSHYAAEAIATHGASRGTLLAARRLLRCRPFGPHGIDLVPEAKPARSSHS
ncbi:MAG TPA: membrane protein insertion efficiency factor YidD [Acidimicrobiales bacterium]|nr:membrane protein insertion efficiency factor YidD [Acidimicrobiales bacterium]